MRDVEERQLQEQIEHPEQAQDAAASGEQDRQRFSSHGAIPAVATGEAVYKPSASQLAYKDDDVAFAPPKPGEAKQEGTSTSATVNDHWPQLLKDFGALFPGAAKLIASQPSSCRFVKECEAGGAKFGGYAGDGKDDAWPYTVQATVYIPKSHGDGLQAMSDFLFELNNAVREPRFKDLRAEARKGDKGSLDAKTYARKVVELEVEGMLKLGEVWLQTKKEAKKEKDKTWSSHDSQFYLQIYLDYQAGKITKADIVDSVLHSTYTEGDDKGKTPEEVYMKQYEAQAQFSKPMKREPLLPLEKP
jgi:hypothetical protein